MSQPERIAYRKGYKAGWEAGTYGKSKKELAYKVTHKIVCPICKKVGEDEL